MSILETFDHALTKDERKIVARLSNPNKIQAFVDTFAYSTEKIYRCPLRVLRDRTAHCFDGALFAAAALRRLGYPPLVLDMLHNGRDDDHLLALYKCYGHWGAVAKSNWVSMRFREPVYRTLRELVMSYFEQYFNVLREKTLRGYTVPLNLKTFDRFSWMVSDDHLERIANRLDEIRRFPLITPEMIDNLSLADWRSYKAELTGANEAGLYQPTKRP